MLHDTRETIVRILKRTLRIDLRYYATGGAWLFLGQLALSGLSLVGAVAFANLFVPQAFGEYRFILAVLGVLALSTLPGMEVGLMRAVARGYERTLVPILSRKILFGLVGSLGAAIGGVYYLYQGNYVLGGGLLVGALFLPIRDSFGLFDTLLTARKEWRTLTFVRPLANGVPMLAAIATLALTESVVAVLAAFFFASTLTDMVILFRTMRKKPLTGGEDSEALSYGYHMSFLRGLGGIAGHAYTIALFQFLGAAPLAQYYFAIAPTEQLRGLIGHIESLLFPRSARDDWHISLGTLASKLVPLWGALALISLLYILAAPYLFTYLFPQYLEAVRYSQLFIPTILLSGTILVLSTIVRSKGLVRVQYLTSIVDSALSFCLAIPLIYLYGVFGLIAAIYVMKVTTLILLGVALFGARNHTQ